MVMANATADGLLSAPGLLLGFDFIGVQCALAFFNCTANGGCIFLYGV